MQAIEMSNIAIHCVANGQVKPNLKWDKDLADFQYNERFQLLGNGTLLINNVQLDDKGTYRCTVDGLKHGKVQLNVSGEVCHKMKHFDSNKIKTFSHSTDVAIANQDNIIRTVITLCPWPSPSS
jgi:Immunoglobulin I-set domain